VVSVYLIYLFGNKGFKMKNIGSLPLLAFATLATASLNVIAAPSSAKSDYLADLSNPMAIYSEAGVGVSNGGVDLYAGFGGYLGGTFAHKIKIEVKDDLDYYEVNYLALDTASQTGFILDSTWDQDDYRFADDVNDTSVGVIKKLSLMNDRLNFYPKLKLGFLWGDEIKSTTYLNVDVAARFNVTSGLWVGMTPGYTYGMKGLDLREWNTSFDVGYQFKEGFGISAQAIMDTHEKEEYRVNFTFIF
jgi:hypothetical protein